MTDEVVASSVADASIHAPLASIDLSEARLDDRTAPLPVIEPISATGDLLFRNTEFLNQLF
jgi:hypothetical protein